MMRLTALAFALTFLSTASAGAQNFKCYNPEAFEFYQVTVPNSDGTGVILEIEVFNTFDPNVGGLIRYPPRSAMLRLDAQGTQRLDPPFKVYNRLHTKIKASLITIPAQADSAALDFIASVANELLGAASDLVFKDQPLLSAISSAMASTLSAAVLDALRGGRIVGSESIEISWLTSSPFIEADGFTVTARPICKSLL